MTKEIIVNAGEQESRVAILENGRLMELHIEREPKIVGNYIKCFTNA
jgi:ribonuclease G